MPFGRYCGIALADSALHFDNQHSARLLYSKNMSVGVRFKFRFTVADILNSRFEGIKQGEHRHRLDGPSKKSQ